VDGSLDLVPVVVEDEEEGLDASLDHGSDLLESLYREAKGMLGQVRVAIGPGLSRGQ
jgi:hypothetical protein